MNSPAISSFQLGTYHCPLSNPAVLIAVSTNITSRFWWVSVLTITHKMRNIGSNTLKRAKKFRKIQDFTKNSTANIIAHFGQYVK